MLVKFNCRETFYYSRLNKNFVDGNTYEFNNELKWVQEMLREFGEWQLFSKGTLEFFDDKHKKLILETIKNSLIVDNVNEEKEVPKSKTKKKK